MRTLGIEEEFLLLDPSSFLPLPRAREVQSLAAGHAGLDADEVHMELLQAQVEIATPVCLGLADAENQLRRLRHGVAVAAETAGCVLSACATPPVLGQFPVPVTDQHRYRALHAQVGRLGEEMLVSGMHVHVGIPDRGSAVRALNHLSPWLSVLVAMGANSPIWEGRDTGFASWRTVVFNRWPVSGPPPYFHSAADYERRADALVRSGVVGDRGQLYWQARISERYPTIEVRAVDTQVSAEAAVVFAGIIRALVETALDEAQRGTPVVPVPPELLQLAMWQAARDGLGGDLMDPVSQLPCKAGDVVSALLEHIAPALDKVGDSARVSAFVQSLLHEGTAADEQRRAIDSGGLEGLLGYVTLRASSDGAGSVRDPN